MGGEPQQVGDWVAAAGDRAQAATPGPWYLAESPFIPQDAVTYIYAGSADPNAGSFVCDMDNMGGEPPSNAEADGKFIAQAREDVPMLVAEVVRLRDELAEAEGERDERGDDSAHWHCEYQAAMDEGDRLRDTIQAVERARQSYLDAADVPRDALDPAAVVLRNVARDLELALAARVTAAPKEER